ncbi:MAG: c-type cytochrome, partial [Verrucomicrobia bacterium]|nr:c-type cytochrome [Verrucomicrobiota bacterium]
NPYLAVRATRKYLANYPDSTRVYPVSRMMQRFNDIDAAMHVTSGNSPTPYRDDLFGPDFATSVFASEPVHNAVHREVLEPDGVTFTSHRASDEQTNEFLASADNWFRPTMMKTGPDGALYIADMYRLVIEHPEWIPADTLKHLDLRAGSDMGRIYRVYPVGAKLRKIPRLDKLSTPELVAALDSPNGWQRDAVQRLLVASHDQAAVRPLEKLAASSARPKTRLQALCTLDGLHALTTKVLERALRDPHPAVREHAVRLSEQFLPAGDARPSRATERLTTNLLKLVDDPSIRVRDQLAFSLGEWNDRRAGLALARLAEKDLQDPNVQTAVMSSAVPHVGEMLDAVLRDSSESPPAGLLDSLFGLATALGNTRALANGLSQVSQPRGGGYAGWQFAALSGFLDALDRRGQSLAQFESSTDPALKSAIGRSGAVFAQARVVAMAAMASGVDRVAAIRLLGRGMRDQAKDYEALDGLLGPQYSPQLQQAALATLARAQGGPVAEMLLSGWSGYGPALRLQVVNVLLTRQAWIPVLLAAIENGKIPPGQISTPHQQKLLASADAAVRERATKLFSATRPDRQKVLAEYQGVADLTGDPARGAPLFKQNCELCHRLRNEGNEIGPDLGGLAEKPIPVLLVAILDPNQSVEARYLSYTAVTKTDQEYSGIIAAETPNSITLKLPGGAEQVILRGDLKELTGSGLSLMPEGFEKALKPQDLADLIAYIKASPSTIRSTPSPGRP